MPSPTHSTRSPIYTGAARPRLRFWPDSDTTSEGGLLAVQLEPPSPRPCRLNRAAKRVRVTLHAEQAVLKGLEAVKKEKKSMLYIFSSVEKSSDFVSI